MVSEGQPELNAGSAGGGSPSATSIRPRVWPALAIVILQLALTFGSGWVAPRGTLVHLMGLMGGPVLGALLFVLWWLFASRVPVRERVIGVLLLVAVAIGVRLLSHETMTFALLTYGLSSVMTAAAAVLLLTRVARWSRCRWLLAIVVPGAALAWTTVRVDGVDGDFTPDFSFRWNPTTEDDFLDSRDATSPTSIQAEGLGVPLDATEADWPGFRGPLRDGRVVGVSFPLDWERRPPRELWRRRVGPGWSSFAVVGDFAFTQEQRGRNEVVVCYGLQDGRERWVNRTQTRFEETAGGPGPRSTPTFDRGRLYTLGATGIVQCLDANTGESLWSRNLTEDVDLEVPTWGFSSSPLVVQDLVIVFARGGGGSSVVALDRSTGQRRWSGGDGEFSYSSAHFARIGDIDQVLMSSNIGLQALDPASGHRLWEHRWELNEARIVQPLVLDGNSVILATGYGRGSRRLNVTRDGESWQVHVRWTSRSLKPYFSDFIHHEGHAYGFDGSLLACVNATDGKRRWKRGRYGHGQVLLVADMGMLLVVSEAGDIVLVDADPHQHQEVARFNAIEGKTWNHPVIARGRLLVRNAEEAACFELQTR